MPLSVKLPLPESATMPTTAWIEPLGNAGLNCIQVELPESTPPGDYRGTVEIGKQQCSIVLEISPRVELRILPATSMVDAQPGARNEFGLTIINVGNVPVEVPKATAFGIYDKQGLDFAIGSAFTAESSGEQRRIDRLMDDMSAGHGGVAQLKVADGAGVLEPGEARELTMELRIPKKAVPGHSYWGIWTLRDFNYKIEIDVTSETGNIRGSGRRS